MLPKGWYCGKVEDFFILQRGFDLTEKEAVPGNTPVYSSSGISYYHNEAKVSGPGVVTGRKGKLGRVLFVETDYWPHDTTLWVKDFKGNYPKFIKYFLDSLQLERLDAASSVPTLNRNNVHALKCVFPPFDEQRQIAAILSTWDETIEKTERLVEGKEKRFSWLLNRLINQRGVKGECRRVKLGDIISESRLPDEENNPGKRLSVRLHLKGVEAREYRGTEAEGATTFFKRKAGQFIYGKQNIFRGALGIIPSELDGYTSTQDIPAFDIASSVYPDWLLFCFSRSAFYKRLELHASGSGSKRFHPKELFNIQLKLPSLEQQKQVAETLNTAQQEIELLKKQAEAYRKQKRGLMQKLLTGEWRVKTI